MTVRHERQSIRKLSRPLKVSSSGVATMKLALMRTATGKEDPELPLLQRISSLEVPALEFAVQIMLHGVKRRGGDFVNQAFMIELLQRKHC